MQAALVQLCSGDDPLVNLPVTQGFVAEAAAMGAQFVLTPEVTNCVSASRARQNEVLRTEAEDPTLEALCQQADALGIWVLIGSLALKTGDADGRFANRSFLIDPRGDIVARYDKIHMFDVEVSAEETYRESDGYKPGSQAVLAQMPDMRLGLTICYDVRFPQLYRALAMSGAGILSVPSAFSPVTGAAHWEPLLRARAIENGAYVLAPAQTGKHAASRGRTRSTHGHSLAVDPWGEVIADLGAEPGVAVVKLHADAIKDARRRVPSLTHTRNFDGP